MPIGGFVVTVLTDQMDRVRDDLRSMAGCDVYDEIGGSASRNNSIVITLEAATSEELESLVEEIKRIEGVLTVDLAYLNIEDEVGR